MSERTSPPTWFWIVAVIALIWNGLGVMNYLNQAYMTAEKLAELPADVQSMYPDVPASLGSNYPMDLSSFHC